MKKIALIFAGGTGKRMGSETPKQFLKVYNKEIIIHTLELFEYNENIDEIYVACIKNWVPYLENLIKKFDIGKVRKVFPGGSTGQDSIFIGLDQIKKENNDAIVLIHDGVRPLVSQNTINKCVDSVQKYGTAITATPIYETPIESIDKNTVSSMPDRSVMYTAQAPQCFYLNDIYNAHLSERHANPNYEGIVDSCGLMFKKGIKPHIIEGNRGNIKVTTPEDFYVLVANLNARDYSELNETTNKQEKPGRIK